MIKLDKVILSSFHEAFRNRETLSGNVTISGTINAGASQRFSTVFTLNRGGSVAEAYIKKAGSGKKTCDANYRTPYFSGSGTASTSIIYDGDEVTCTITVGNGTGSPITLTTQTYTFELVVFDTPF